VALLSVAAGEIQISVCVRKRESERERESEKEKETEERMETQARMCYEEREELLEIGSGVRPRVKFYLC